MAFYDEAVRIVKTWFTDSSTITEAPSSTGGGSAKRDPMATIIKRLGLAIGVGTSRDFQAPEYDLTTIATAYDNESYVRQSVDKYIELMFKAGWDVIGKNENAVEYIKLRLKLIAEMTQIPSEQLFIEMAEDLVKYSNSIVVKARDKGNLIGGSKTGINVQGLGGQAPIAGYFPLNATTLKIKRDKNGTIQSWQQEVTGGDKAVTYKTQDVVHIYYKREKGRAFGTPFLVPVLNDIQALRQAEETVLKMIYRNLNPFLHIQVGTTEIPGQTGEITAVQTEFQNMDIEAGLVTSERVKINAVAADKIIDANAYLKYFEQRVFTGLGVSELMMGRGATASRSTGDNLSNEFTDRVKAYQKVLGIFIDEFIIKELLMEGGFDPILNPDDDVDFVFKEIDVDAKIKAENHAIFQYEHNSITEDEMRSLLGRDPISDRALMFMSLVTIPVAQETAAAKAPVAGTAATDNKNKPTNQHKTKTSPKKQSNETEFKHMYIESIESTFENSHSAVTKLIDRYLESNDKQQLTELSNVIRYTEEDIIVVMQKYLGLDYTTDYVAAVHKVCQDLHYEVTDLLVTLNGSQRNERIYETAGGIYHVLHMQIHDIAEHAYESYLKLSKEEEVEDIE